MEEAQGFQEQREGPALDNSLMVYVTLIQNFLQMFLETAGLTVDHSIWIHVSVMLVLYCGLLNVQQPMSAKKMDVL